MVANAKLALGDELFVAVAWGADVSGCVGSEVAEVVIVLDEVLSALRTLRNFRSSVGLVGVVPLVSTKPLEGSLGQLQGILHDYFLGLLGCRSHIVGVVGTLPLKRVVFKSVHLAEDLRAQVLILPIEALVGVVVAGFSLKATVRQHKVFGLLWIGCSGSQGFADVLALVVGDEILGVVMLSFVWLLLLLR